MGNHALRVEASRLLKDRGIHTKLYRGKKARQMLSAHFLHEIIRKLAFKPGDVVNDCDGMNHVIVAFAYEERGISNFQRSISHWGGARNSRSFFVEIPQYLFADGRFSCGCPAGCEPAKSRDEIEGWYARLSAEFISRQMKTGWGTALMLKRRETILAGGHICDERGLLLPGF